MNNRKACFSSEKQDWETPKHIFDALNNKFNFTLDACASDNNHLCQRYYTKEDNCLDIPWNDEVVFMNPPYGRKIGEFVKKSWEEHVRHNITVVMLLPARTDTKWFQDYLCYATLLFLKGRLKFTLNNEEFGTAPFPSVIAILSMNSSAFCLDLEIDGTFCFSSGRLLNKKHAFFRK